MNEEMINDIASANKLKYVLSIVKLYIYLLIKRMFDLLLALIGCVFLVPIAIVIKIVSIINKDFNSIFYCQKRIGKGGREFNLYKFRSMIPDADIELKRILKEDKKLAKEYKVNKKLKNDPRITKIGKFIRRYSIDELPQLINILRGDMTFIGNRPYLPREKKDMGDYYDVIVRTKPGLTGYWQVSGRSNVSFEYRLILEEYYSLHCSLRFDIKIFFKTFKAVFGCKGAK